MLLHCLRLRRVSVWIARLEMNLCFRPWLESCGIDYGFLTNLGSQIATFGVRLGWYQPRRQDETTVSSFRAVSSPPCAEWLISISTFAFCRTFATHRWHLSLLLRCPISSFSGAPTESPQLPCSLHLVL